MNPSPDAIDAGELELLYCATALMLADFLTKALAYLDYVRLTSGAMATQA
jgi:hypothetical protein